MKKPLVAVLGCGPAGLIAAHTLEHHRVPFVIFSKKQQSVLGGAQFSHIEIPGITEDPDAILTYEVRGTPEVYQSKVYGDTPVPFVSFDNVKDGQTVKAWNLRKMYDVLWARFEDRIVPYAVTPDRAAFFAQQLVFDLVFSSVPAPALCTDALGHWFRSQPVKIWNNVLDIKGGIKENTIIYDGLEEHSYYRLSSIFGTTSTEWGANAGLPPVVDVKTVNKPIETNCDCHKGITRIGRFGTWTKGVLTMHAYRTVIDSLAQWGIEL